MRIGKFAESNNISIDTVRYYMELGLIVPEKRNGQYYFDDKDYKELQGILNLKRMGFSLSEIRHILFFRRLGKYTPYQEDEYYQAFYINKQRSIEQEILKLSNVKSRLEEKLSELTHKSPVTNTTIGIDIRNLSIFRCLKCNSAMILSNGKIINNQIIDGKLNCECGNEYCINSGILEMDINEHYQTDFLYDYDFLREYLDVTDNDFLDNTFQGLRWIENKVNSIDLNNKIVLELGTGLGVLLRYIFDKLPTNCTYIAVDHNINTHKFVKSVLERVDCQRNIVLVCADFQQIPIRDKYVDVVVDFYGTTNFSLNSSDFLLEKVDDYIKDEALLLGAHILFKNFVINSVIEEENRKNFILANIKDKISKLNYKIVSDHVSYCIDKGGKYGGKYESFFLPGEKIYQYMIEAKR